MSTKPKIKFLSAQELIAQTNLHNEIDPSILVRGLKAKFPTYSNEERATIKSYLDDLHKVLSMERVALKHDRSMALFESGKIKLTKRQGKWDGFESSGDYLEPHEALYLIEINRLEVYVGKVIVSLERAYHMFLNHENHSGNVKNDSKLTKNEYLVYSHFKRFGCNLRRFKNQQYLQESSESEDEYSNDVNNEKSYIWHYLHELLGNRKAINCSRNLDHCRYNAIKNSMNNTIDEFKNVGQRSTLSNRLDTAESSGKIIIPEKRKLSHCDLTTTVSKLPKLCQKNSPDGQYFGSGSTNDFMVDGTFQKFKQIFKLIEIINIHPVDIYDKQQCSIQESFTFDLWTSIDYREFQYNGPNFRLIIKHSSKSLPRNDDIFRLYQSLIHKSAIIVVFINEEMSFQAYVYRFTT